ncbi:Mbov_0395 family pilin-like conjugal transfer protein [Mycoplasma yeatsii]|uniref:Mbov_0395 family pilin-like conjugal transfer protein n=1 Tax=Mycoplasma yeatsii TaxID=51365 RepID=UPI0005B24092|nr:hypothetical protein [Mycoplasma yeatsii]AJM71559.1 hypothetical protein MYE_00305 [Mycoplasma yeatsii GM274B]
MLYTIKNIVLMNASGQGKDGAEAIVEVSNLILKYMAIGFGAAAGALAFITGILALWAMFKASKATGEEARQEEFKKVKLSAIFLMALLGFWGFISAVVGIVQAVAQAALTYSS